MSERRDDVEKLIERAAEATRADDAMKFSQAASNAANALCAMKAAEENDASNAK